MDIKQYRITQLKEVKKRESYIKPGEKRRNAKKEAIKNSRRKERSYNRAA